MSISEGHNERVRSWSLPYKSRDHFWYIIINFTGFYKIVIFVSISKIGCCEIAINRTIYKFESRFLRQIFFLSMPFPARKCGDFLFVDGIISVLIPVSIQALVPILMPVLMLTSRPRKFSATIFLGSIAGPDYACLVRVFFARWFLPGGALRIKSHPFSPILRAPENRSGRSYAEQPLFYGGKMYV